MEAWKGNTSTNASTTILDVDSQVEYLIIINSAAVPSTVNIFIKNGTTFYRVSPKPITLVAGQAYEAAIPYCLNAGEVLYFDTTQSTDYYANITTRTR